MPYGVLVRVTPKSPVRLIGPFSREESAREYKDRFFSLFHSSRVIEMESPDLIARAVHVYLRAYTKALLPFTPKGRKILKEMRRR